MPFFEYKCSDCGAKYEILHRSSTSTQEIVCPKCKSLNSKKLLSAFSANVPGSPTKFYDDCAISGGCSPSQAASCGCAGGCGH